MFLHRFKLKNYCCVVMWMYVGLFMVACASREQTIVLLHTNDSHGSILPVSGVGGMAERATVIDSLRKLYSNKILLLDAGDFNTGDRKSVV